MPYFLRGGVRYWVGVHQSLGLVVFDPEAQGSAASGRVRLFIYPESRMATFASDIARPRVSSSVSGYNFAGALDAYMRLREHARQASCFRCGESLNSVDYAVCPDCCWIRCICGACGCTYSGEVALPSGDRAITSRPPPVAASGGEERLPSTIAEAISQCIRGMPRRLTRTSVARILVGSSAASVQRYRSHRLFGRYSYLSRKAVVAEVDRLIEAGAIRQDGKRLFPAVAVRAEEG
jgi:hypothetical protein